MVVQLGTSKVMVKLTCCGFVTLTNLKMPYEKFRPITKLEAESPHKTTLISDTKCKFAGGGWGYGVILPNSVSVIFRKTHKTTKSYYTMVMAY